MWRIVHTSVFFVVLISGIMLSGCASGGDGAGSSGNAQKSESATSTSTGTAQASGETAPEKEDGGDSEAAGRDSSIPALAGVERAEQVARKWHQDAKLYAIASLSPEVDARGRSPGWLYSYVSTSAKEVALISVEKGEAEIRQEPPVPNSQIPLIARQALPPPEALLDSPQAIDRAGKVKKANQENPNARVSAGLDSFSSEEPVWILTTISKGGERIEQRVPATF